MHISAQFPMLIIKASHLTDSTHEAIGLYKLRLGGNF
jgi:hypothetical protein